MVKNLKKFTCDLAHQLIIERIGDTQKLPVEYKERLNILKSAGTEYNVYMGEINVDNISMDVIKQVIGKNGCYFIQTTINSDLDFIWHNRTSKAIEFWGPYDNIEYGMNIINSRIKNKSITSSIEEEFENYKM